MKGTTDSEIAGFISDGCTNARCQEHTKERNETIAIAQADVNDRIIPAAVEPSRTLAR
jgi:hypothetical protein